ncbi:hypothetical protein C8Q76DRAFT_797163 [Earliella scabrosa]|nr:hypothetical protein C8Q76DRAFT_797163 [Earliella scabrosa]
MSIHRCPPEVIQQICEWLLKVSFGKYTLVALARTHPIFHEPAVNALWHTIPSVAILFWTLPQECYTRARVPNHTQWTQFQFAVPLEGLDFTRFRFYAARVRALNAIGSVRPHVSHEVKHYIVPPKSMRELVAFFDAKGWRMLPNLSELSFFLGPLPYTIFRSLPCLLNRRLHTFHIKTYDIITNFPKFSGYPRPTEHQDFEEHLVALFKHLQMTCPNVREFTFGANPSSVPIVNAVMDACCSFNHLTEFRCGELTLPLSFKALTHLALLPNLRVLKFGSDRTFWTFDDFWLLDHKRKDKIFPALRDIGMITLTVDLPLKILPYVSSRHLERVEVKVIEAVPRKRFKPLFEAIASLKGHMTINHVYVLMDVAPPDPRASVNGDAPAYPSPISMTTLAPLFSLPRLLRLELDILCPWDLDDELLLTMGVVWPELEVLELGIERPWPLQYRVRPPSATFRGLMALSRACGHLHTLGLEWAPDGGDRLGTFPHVFVPLSPVEMLRVGYSRVGADEELAVASLLSNAFPRLREIESHWVYARDGVEEAAWKRHVAEMGGEDAVVPGEYEIELDEAEREEWTEYDSRSGAWSTVAGMVPELVLVRKQERTWIEGQGVYEKVSGRLCEETNSDPNDPVVLGATMDGQLSEDDWASFKLKMAIIMRATRYFDLEID